MARHLQFQMDESDLDLSHSVLGSLRSSAAKRLPRPFDVSLTNILPVSSSATTQRTAGIQEKSTVLANISEKLDKDKKSAASFREEESRMRQELERSKIVLIEQYQINEAKLIAELLACKAQSEQHLKEKEALWTERDAVRVQELQKLEQKVADIIEMSRKRLADKDKITVEQLEKQEEVWKQRLERCMEENEDQMRALRDKLTLEKESHIVAEKARLAAKEDQARNAFETKLKNYEQEIHEVMRNYHDKELIIHGSLDEARKEIVLMRNAWAAKETSLRDELAAKDRIINRLQSKLHLVDDITKVADSWRGAARDLARIVVNACVTIQDMPPLPEPPKEATTAPQLLMGYGGGIGGLVSKEDEGVLRQRQAYAAETKAYYRARRDLVTIRKDLVGRALRNSKKVIERVQAETVPAADFKLTADEDDE